MSEWLVVDVQTGAMDGCYMDRALAEGAMRRAEARGAHSIVLCQVVAAVGKPVVSEQVFWTMHPVGYAGDHKREAKQ